MASRINCTCLVRHVLILIAYAQNTADIRLNKNSLTSVISQLTATISARTYTTASVTTHMCMRTMCIGLYFHSKPPHVVSTPMIVA